MKTIVGIPCNNYLHTPRARQNRIVYRFVSDGTNTPSSCTVRLRDTDPLTGEKITDIGFFTEYYRLREHQVYENMKAVKADMTAEEKRRFSAEKQNSSKHSKRNTAVNPAGASSATRWQTVGRRSITSAFRR